MIIHLEVPFVWVFRKEQSRAEHWLIYDAKFLLRKKIRISHGFSCIGQGELCLTAGNGEQQARCSDKLQRQIDLEVVPERIMMMIET